MFLKVKVFKKKLKRHNDQVMSIYSPKGIEGGILISGSADHEIRSKLYRGLTFIDWHLVKKKISSKINV